MGAFQSIEDIPAHGGLATFNIQDGFVEAVCRGYRKGFLSDSEYFQLRGASTLSDVKLNLGDTDYKDFLLQKRDNGGDATQVEISPALIKKMAIKKFTTEFEFMRVQANQPLATFLDYISYEYMIKNIVHILSQVLKNPDVKIEVIKQGIHPMGKLSDLTMNLIASFKSSTKALDDLVQNVLVNTPVGKYFEQYMMSFNETGKISGGGEVKKILNEKNYMMIEHHVMRLYLEDFYRFCLDLGGETAEVMGNLLEVRADELSINIVLNSFDWALGKDNDKRTRDRQDLLPSFGRLYPQGMRTHDDIKEMTLKDVKSVAELGKFLDSYKDYKDLWKIWAPASGADGDDDDETMGNFEDGWYHFKLELHETAFLGQCHYAPFYAFVKLKEQEVRNLNFISECIMHRKNDSIKYIPVFSDRRKLRAWSKMETRDSRK